MRESNIRNRRLRAGLLVAGLLLVALPVASSGPVGGLVTFVNGTIADADQVNANFTAVANAVNDNDARISLIEGALATGLTVGGPVTADSVQYNAPRTHYFSVPGSSFQPWNDTVGFQAAAGLGGAYITSGFGNLIAPLHLPDGAVMTDLKAYFNDTSANDMAVDLLAERFDSGGFILLATVNSNTNTGFYSLNTPVVASTSAIVDNQTRGYLIAANSLNWNSNLQIQGVVVTYTIAEAE